MELPGGGGFGHPFERDPQSLVRDVLNGYVSIEGARDNYGVVIRRRPSADDFVVLPEDLEIDEAGTSRLRLEGKPRCVEEEDG